MKEYKINTNKSGNCSCGYCGKVQDGRKMQPYTVWWKDENESRGHQEPMCSKECCEKFIEKSKKEV